MCVHYGSLGIKQNIKYVWIDKETRGKSIGWALPHVHPKSNSYQDVFQVL